MGSACSFGQYVTNGGFEDTIGNDVPIYQGETVGGWTVVSSVNRATVISNTYAGTSLPNTPFGTQQLYVDANGFATTISAPIVGLTPNSSYEFSFYMTEFFGAGKVNASVRDGSNNVLDGNIFTTPAGGGWMKHSFQVSVANDTNLKFFFATVPGSFAAVDNIQIAASPVPEPASMAAIGIGVLGLLRRKRRS